MRHLKVLIVRIIFVTAILLALVWLETRHYRQHYPPPVAQQGRRRHMSKTTSENLQGAIGVILILIGAVGLWWLIQGW